MPWWCLRHPRESFRQLAAPAHLATRVLPKYQVLNTSSQEEETRQNRFYIYQLLRMESGRLLETAFRFKQLKQS